jgi:hypothetical protein
MPSRRTRRRPDGRVARVATCALRPRAARFAAMGTLSTDDRLAISEVLSSYCHGVDRRQWGLFRSLFTSDIRLDLSQALGIFEGSDGIERFIATIDALPITMRHLVTNIVIEGDGERARVQSYVVALTGEPGKMQRGTGFYDDELVKTEGRWRLRHRRLLLDGAAPQ